MILLQPGPLPCPASSPPARPPYDIASYPLWNETHHPATTSCQHDSPPVPLPPPACQLARDSPPTRPTTLLPLPAYTTPTQWPPPARLPPSIAARPCDAHPTRPAGRPPRCHCSPLMRRASNDARGPSAALPLLPAHATRIQRGPQAVRRAATAACPMCHHPSAM